MIRENIHARMILTDRGLRPENEIVQGDHVIEYKTNNLLEVADVQLKRQKRFYTVNYSDGRFQFVSENELVLNGSEAHYPEEYRPDKYRRNEIIQHPIEFRDSETPLDPDPYMAGAIFGYADYTSPYVNLKSHCADAINYIKEKYHCSTSINGNTIVFVKPYETEYYTWDDMFPNYRFFARRNHIDDPAFPLPYMYGSIPDRIHFIRGIFDAGYIQSDSPDSVAINHWSSDRLEWVQWILWSLGILSRVTTHTKNPYNYGYRLDVVGAYKYWPGIFTNYDYIANMIDTDNRITKTDPIDILYIDYIEESPNYFKNELAPHFYFADANHHVLINDQLLPCIK